MGSNQRQFGTALITALFVTALTAILATALMVSQRLLIRQTSLVNNADTMYLDLQGVQDWAQTTLTKNVDLLKIKSLQQHFHGTQLTGKIIAQGGLFNINSLAETKNQPRFIKLLRKIIPAMTAQQAGDVTKAISEWVLPSQSDDYYTQLNPPYRAPHRLIINISELRAVRGVTASIYHALRPYITALPVRQYQVDVNYAPALVLMTLTDTMTLNQAQSLVACRKTHGLFKSVNDYISLCAPKLPIDNSSITVDDNYYLVEGTAERGDQQLQLTSLLMKYSQPNNHLATKILWQELS